MKYKNYFVTKIAEKMFVHLSTLPAMLTLAGAAALGQGQVPGVHHRARSQQRLRPVGLLDPGEERVAFHPGAAEDRHHCRGLCAALKRPSRRIKPLRSGRSETSFRLQ